MYHYFSSFIDRLLEPGPMTVRSVWKQDINGGHTETIAIFSAPFGYRIDAVDWSYRYRGSGGWRSERTAGPVLSLFGLPPGKDLTIIGTVVAATEIC